MRVRTNQNRKSHSTILAPWKSCTRDAKVSSVTLRFNMSFQDFLRNFKINRFQPLICCCFLRCLPDVMPVFFEGAKLMVNKGLSNHFQVSHTINLTSAAPSGYRFGATYVGTKQFGPGEAFPVILGDIDPSGNLNANVIHQFAPNVRCKFASQVSKIENILSQL